MKMMRFEKFFVNKVLKGEANVRRVRKALEEIGVDGIGDALELGCGIGVVSAFLAETYRIRVTGTDYDPAQIDLAKARYAESDRLGFQTADATNMTFEDASFDLVVSQNVFHHIANWQDAAREIARILRPGGVFIWDDFCVYPALKPLFSLLSRWLAVYTMADIEAVFAKHSLEVLVHEHGFRGPFGQHFLVLKKERAA